MRKRFQQNRQDISFTIMTYMPLFSKHILNEMDVEALTTELQSLSRAAKAPRIPRAVVREQQQPPPHRQQSPRTDSLESSAELVRSSDARSETSSASYLSISPRPEDSQLADSMTESLQLPGHTPQSLEASSSASIELQGSPSASSTRFVEPKAAPSESVISSSAVSSNGDSVVSA
jgi:peroxin-3